MGVAEWVEAGELDWEASGDATEGGGDGAFEGRVALEVSLVETVGEGFSNCGVSRRALGTLLTSTGIVGGTGVCKGAGVADVAGWILATDEGVSLACWRTSTPCVAIRMNWRPCS